MKYCNCCGCILDKYYTRGDICNVCLDDMSEEGTNERDE